MCIYRRNRSIFWLGIFDEDKIRISTIRMVKNLIDLMVFPKIAIKWYESRNREGIYHAYLPKTDCNLQIIEYIQKWAENANKHIWLGLNKNISPFFSGDEVDYCLAGGWNIDPQMSGRTIVGNAEYQMKYRLFKGEVNEIDALKYSEILDREISNCMNCLPFQWDTFIFTTIPSVVEKQNKLSWQLAERAAQHVNAAFARITLLVDKPQIKEQLVEDKITIWRSIFSQADQSLLVHENIRGRDICIIDDLYQSGVSVWSFSEFLKNKYDIRTVVAITPVKALKDGGNT